jgi:hypothetical protein
MQANTLSNVRHDRPFAFGESLSTLREPNREHIVLVLGIAHEIENSPLAIMAEPKVPDFAPIRPCFDHSN